jgi:hypothetical protein
MSMKRTKTGSTIKQVAYARKIFNGDGQSKKDIARSVGYSLAMANNVQAKIEDTEGFINAMQKLAQESNNLVMEVLLEYKKRGLTEFSNKDLNGALNAISTAWDRIGKQRAGNKNQDPKQNKLRAVMMQHVENQTVVMPRTQEVAAPAKTAVVIPNEEVPDLDF